jgi:diphthamide synthase (EF-2-diphthine--ammonia ligase)
VEALLTTLTQDFDRISIHGVRRVLLERQAEALGLALKEMFIAKGASNVNYERELLNLLTQQRADGVSAVVCGDIFLEDVRKYREELLAKAGLRGVYRCGIGTRLSWRRLS